MDYPIFRTSQGIRKVKLNSLQSERDPYQSNHPSSAACILLIDDSATIRKIVTMTLTQAGYEIQTFPDGIAAMRWLAEPGSRLPDLMLVDLGLPKMDGYEVIRRIKVKPQFAHTRCIILSRRDGMVDKLKGRLAGAMIYLAKPFTTQALLTAVRTSLAR